MKNRTRSVLSESEMRRKIRPGTRGAKQRALRALTEDVVELKRHVLALSKMLDATRDDMRQAREDIYRTYQRTEMDRTLLNKILIDLSDQAAKSVLPITLPEVR